jgi:23S rRNA (cytosine1962-C5)-methyltransferase
MKIISTPGWDEYSLLDSGEGYRLEQFGKFRIIRPDPQCIWKKNLNQKEWDIADASFKKDDIGKERWITKGKMPQKWLMHYKSLSFYAKLTPFKHTGIFPEQHLQWDWMSSIIEKKHKEEISSKTKNQKPKILNLFAYTGIASLAAAIDNCDVTHVDASFPSIAWAKENQTASSLSDKLIRWIKDDVIKFCEREVRRGNKYDGIIIDPPVYGHGPNGEIWDFKKSFPKLLSLCRQLLSNHPLFIIINAYAISSSSIMLENVLSDCTNGIKGTIEVGELCLQEKHNKRLLSTGIFARFSQ